MIRRIWEGARGTGEARNALRELGISAFKLARLSPDKQIPAVAEAMERVGSSGDRVRPAFKLFDSEGVALLQLLNKGKGTIRDSGQQARFLGVAISDLNVVKFTLLTRDLELSKSKIGGVVTSIAQVLTPALDFAVTAFLGIGDGAEFARKATGHFISFSMQGPDHLRNAAKFAGDAVRSIAAGALGIRGRLGAGAALISVAGERLGIPGAGLARSAAGFLNPTTALNVAGQLESELAERMAGRIPNAISDSFARFLREFEQRAKELEAAREKLRAGIAGGGLFGGGGSGSRAPDVEPAMLVRASEIISATRMPAEKYKKAMNELRTMLDAAALSQDTFNRAAKAARLELTGPSIARSIPGSTFGSQAAVRDIAFGSGPDSLAVKAVKQRNEILKKIEIGSQEFKTIMRDIRRAMDFNTVTI